MHSSSYETKLKNFMWANFALAELCVHVCASVRLSNALSSIEKLRLFPHSCIHHRLKQVYYVLECDYCICPVLMYVRPSVYHIGSNKILELHFSTLSTYYGVVTGISN